MRKIPSEAVQISAQIFALEMAKHVNLKKGIAYDEALQTSIDSTRQCMDNLGLTEPKKPIENNSPNRANPPLDGI